MVAALCDAGSGQTPPSERIRVAAIGCAGRPSPTIVGVAAVALKSSGSAMSTRAAPAKCKEKFKQALFKDYRQMLDKIDKRSTP